MHDSPFFIHSLIHIYFYDSAQSWYRKYRSEQHVGHFKGGREEEREELLAYFKREGKESVLYWKKESI